jgi:hypothetical protein
MKNKNYSGSDLSQEFKSFARKEFKRIINKMKMNNNLLFILTHIIYLNIRIFFFHKFESGVIDC